MTEGELKKMQQEAVRRTREMQRRAAAYSEPDVKSEAGRQTAQEIRTKEKEAEIPDIPLTAPRIQSTPKTPETDAGMQYVSGGVFEALFKDKEKTLILGLILLLMDEKTDNGLLMALVYLLI